jgi:hypothetical protein
MKTYTDFLTEKKAFSPRGQEMREKMRRQNEENRKEKEEEASKGSAIVKVPGSEKTEKESVGKTKETPTEQRRPPGVSGFSRPTTARVNSSGRRNAISIYQQKQLEKKAEEARKERNKKRTELAKKAIGVVGDQFKKAQQHKVATSQASPIA